MIGIYFSGTGNTKFCVDKFLAEYDNIKNTFSIEDKCTLDKIKNNHEIIIGYPVQYSNIPKILRDYVTSNQYIWKGKKVFIIATMGLFSGDGAGILARLLNSYGAVISGGLHLKMPDSIGDVKVLKRSPEKNKELVIKAEEKCIGCGLCKSLCPMGNISIKNGLAVSSDKCTMCYRCISRCPKQAITLLGKRVIDQNDINKYI